MKQQTKLTQAEAEQQAAEHQAQAVPVREFASVEELLRHDATATAVPPGIAQRLQKSAGEIPRPRAAWWKRLFGGNNP